VTRIDGAPDATESTELAAATPRRSGRRRRRWILVIGGIVVLLGAALLVRWIWFRSAARPVSVGEALARFEPGDGAAAGRPAQGVYVYRGTGSESLSVPPKSQDQGPELPVTVTWRRGGCWVFRVDYSTNHWQTWNYCTSARGLEERGGQTFQRWDLVVTKVESLSTFSCDPPSVAIRSTMRAGDTWQQECRGSSNSVKGRVVSRGPYRYVGEETLTVGATKVKAFHFRQERTLSGAQQGTQRADVWFRTTDGLPLRNVRSVTVDTDSIVGTVTYRESGSFELAQTRVRS
jgi:hypothetical protein